MEGNKFQSEIRELFLQNKLEECIENVANQEYKDLDLQSYKYSQIYKVLSNYELSFYSEGEQCFQEFVDHNFLKNEGKVEEIDVIMRTLWQQQKFDHNKSNAIQSNSLLLEVCQQYKSQHQNVLKWNEDIFNFGMSMYSFIDTFFTNPDLSYVQKLIDSLENIIDFKQEIMFIIAWIYDNLDMHDTALNWYQILEKANQNYPGLTNNLGLIYRQKGINNKAEEYYLKSYQINQKSGCLLINLAVFYKNINEFKKAEEFFNKSILANPKRGKYYSFYGNFLISQQRDQEGLKTLLTGLENNPNETCILNSLMKIEYEKANFTKSKEYLQKMIEIDQIDGNFEYEYGSLEMDNGNYESALEYFRKSLKKRLMKDEIQSCNISIGLIYFQNQEYLKSLEQQFYICNMNLYQMNVDAEIQAIDILLNNQDLIPSEQQRIYTINSQFGIVQTRFQKIIELSNNQVIKSTLMQKHEQFTTVLSFLAYFANIQPYLHFMSDLNHWDLFID